MKSKLVNILYAILLSWSFPFLASAEIGLTFPLKLELDLCPEYSLGGVEILVKYTIGSEITPHEVTIDSQSIDSSSGKGTFEIELPTIYGTNPLNVAAYCKNNFGESAPSNILSVSNCDALALLDTDKDGITNNLEDTDCTNFFSPGDASNPDNIDTDGDGVRDLVEVLSATDPTNPASSPRPIIFSGGPFDPDRDGNSNPVVWRSSTETWYIRDFVTQDNHLAIQFGLSGDTPFVYKSQTGQENIGVIRKVDRNYLWLFRGDGFINSDKENISNLNFGIFGDNIILGPWEQPGVTNPAIARLFNNKWTFFIYQSDGTIKRRNWGANGDLLKVQDYDGDGIFDFAVYRPSEQKIYVIQSSDGLSKIYNFGSGTAEYTVRGDYTGDGIDDISFWEPRTGIFSTMISDSGFDDNLARNKVLGYYEELQLGLYNIHLPLSWNKQHGKILYTVIDHNSGERFFRKDNLFNNPIQSIQWGLPGDAQG